MIYFFRFLRHDDSWLCLCLVIFINALNFRNVYKFILYTFLRLSKVRNVLVIGFTCFFYHFSFLITFGFVCTGLFTFWFLGHLELFLWCKVPCCVEDCTVTVDALNFCLGLLNLAMECRSLTLNQFPFFFIFFQMRCKWR